MLKMKCKYNITEKKYKYQDNMVFLNDMKFKCVGLKLDEFQFLQKFWCHQQLSSSWLIWKHVLKEVVHVANTDTYRGKELITCV